MKLYDIIEIIKLTEQRGQELLIDALVMGIEIGRGNISDFNDLKSVVEQLKNLKQKIDNSLFSPFIRDDIYDRIINEKENLADVLQSFQNSLRRISQQNIQNGVCQVCNKYVHGQDKMKTIQWECNHLFHQQCVLPNLIIQNQTSPKYQCPICENQTPKDEIMNQLQNNKQQVVSCCPTPACRKKFVFQGQEIYRCQNCKKKYCLRCFSQSHGINKCQTSDNIEFKNGDNYKECPNCKKWIKTSQVDSTIQCYKCNKTVCLGCNDSKCSSCCQKKEKFFSSFLSKFSTKQQ
ncbi:unnamed protein product [Paramecium octaurelia]|uniref:RING-type domain-containing protein n=1 Tax=Paramecium octaurelia TaxID=43137 RepID=A0A8S1XC21_PAROT|nr:unnamed protein product [Paramecium octaurelia]